MEPTSNHVEIDNKMKNYFKHNSSKLAYRGSALGIICVISFTLAGCGCALSTCPVMRADLNGLGESEIGDFIQTSFAVGIFPRNNELYPADTVRELKEEYPATIQELKEKISSRIHGKTTKTDLENTLEKMGMHCNIIKNVCIYSGSVKGVRVLSGQENLSYWQTTYILSINTEEGISSMTFNILASKLLK
jgi:hypothetical protein